MPHGWLRGATNREAGRLYMILGILQGMKMRLQPNSRCGMIYIKGAAMNIFESKEAKIKAYLKYLNKSGATNRKNAVKIDDRLFDEITKYLVADGSIQRAAGLVYITKAGVFKL